MRAAAGVVLAGGESSRFGSDKALALFRGAPLLAHAVRALQAQFAQVIVVAKEPARYAAIVPGAELVADRSALRTPLAGLEAGLQAAAHEVVFLCAADMPFAADALLLDALCAALSEHDAAAPVHAGEIQPLCALYRRAPCLAAAAALLQEKPAGPRALLARTRTAKLAWPDPRPFLDANTPAQLSALEGG